MPEHSVHSETKVEVRPTQDSQDGIPSFKMYQIAQSILHMLMMKKHSKYTCSRSDIISQHNLHTCCLINQCKHYRNNNAKSAARSRFRLYPQWELGAFPSSPGNWLGNWVALRNKPRYNSKPSANASPSSSLPHTDREGAASPGHGRDQLLLLSRIVL